MFTETSVDYFDQKVVYPRNEAPLLVSDKWSEVWRVLETSEDLNFTDATTGVSMADRIRLATQSIYEAITSGWTCQVAVSGGKDSGAVLHLFLMALVRAVRNGSNVSPYHFITTSDTGVENPEIRWHCDNMLSQLQAFIDKESLPLTILVASPSIAQGWVGRILTGRGLPSWPSSGNSQCTHDLKITPSRQAKKRYLRKLPASVRKKVCLLLGSRDDEGSNRAANIARMGGQASTITMTNEGGELYPVKDWGTQDIWSLLMECGSEDRYPLPGFMQNNLALAELYKDATGECVWTSTGQIKSSGCSSRFGCFSCQAVSEDKSMKSLLAINPERYAYQEGLNRLQRYLSKIRFDWSKRSYIGKTLFAGGYVRLQPDVFSSAVVERLFHVCCSLDYVEHQRAQRVREQLNWGNLPDTPYNRRMSEPQFRIVSEANVIHVDFLWALNCFHPEPFRAMTIFRSVWLEGKLDLLEDEPEMIAAPRSPQPAPVWLRIPAWAANPDFDGLADPLAIQACFDGQDDPRAVRRVETPEGTRCIVAFGEDDEVTVDEDSAAFIIWNEYPDLARRARAGEFTPGAAAQYLLRFGVVSLAKGKGTVYHRMAARGQLYHRMGLSDRIPLETLRHSGKHKIISDRAYRQLVARKLNGQLKASRFWYAVAFTAALHQHNNTALGEWITRELQTEEERLATDRQLQANERLRDLVLNLCSMRLAWILRPALPVTTTERLQYRHARRQAYHALRLSRFTGNRESVDELMWTLRCLVASPGTQDIEFWSLREAHHVRPDALKRIVGYMLKGIVIFNSRSAT
ncbi:Predicted phosphoadenosine phosphosulfate sulfotransferase [Enterobacter hormaechei]|uniref:phosphoadenosine phosphosulfate reductase family protein n=1 Tax=Enterobacteriaceae TaxID=543 RepID=UPI0009818ADC|nr:MULTISPECIES: phosphoadenosine phosphosulfate reductase family protein [Enterobacteriaceae]OOB84484.1 phosphoadenosine phosphosulfate reductase [Leclercia adecarboxylata]VAE21577.1 Predicted phosphoadenosine phosphosulfate sulfotransferase [Enterobacter hormaechei]VAE27050.1 Predicted phosphoadenosine phosphosulfate sulfotransferase [Enterobacter hormaechei]